MRGKESRPIPTLITIMKKCILFFLFLTIAAAEESDTTKVYQLQHVIILRQTEQHDAAIDFYRANSAATTEEILARSQSVQMIRRGNYGLEPSIRGFSAGQISLTIDGMHIHGACTDKMDPVTIYVEPQNLYSIDVAAGAGGLAFGSSPGGAVNMRLAAPTYATTFSSAGSGFQSSSRSFNGNFSLNSGTENMALLVSGVYRKSGNYTAANGMEIPFSLYEKSNLSMSGALKPSAGEEIRADVLFDDGWNIGYPSLTMDAGYAKARMYSMSYHRSFADNMISTVAAKVYGNAVTHFMDDTRRPSVPMHMDMPGWSSTYGGFVNTVLVPAEHHVTTLRAEIYRTTVRAEMTMYPAGGTPMFMLTLPDARRWTTALYVNDVWNIAESYVFSFAARSENVVSNVTSELGRRQLTVFGYNTENSDRRPMLSGSITLTKQLREEMDASFTAGYAERVPSLNEAYGFYLYNRFDGYDYVGDPGLGNERSLQAEATIRHQTEFLQISATGFVNRINGYIDGAVDAPLSAMTIGAHGVKRFQNLPYALMRGMEVLMLLHPQEQLEIVSTLKYVCGTDDSNVPLQLIPPLKLLSSVRYRLQSMMVQVEGEYASPQHLVRASVGERITPSYFLSHLRMSYAVPFQEIQCALHGGIENLFDTQYRDHLDWGNIPRPGRNYYASVTFSR